MQNLVSKNPILRFKLGRKIVKAFKGYRMNSSGLWLFIDDTPTRERKTYSSDIRNITPEKVVPLKDGRTIAKINGKWYNQSGLKVINFVSSTSSNKVKEDNISEVEKSTTPKRPLKTKEQWESLFNNAKNLLTAQQLMYLDSLGIDTSSAEKMQQSINAYNKNSELVVDNKWGDKSSTALSKILSSIPTGYRNKDTLWGLDNEKNIPDVVTPTNPVVTPTITPPKTALLTSNTRGSNDAPLVLKRVLGKNNNFLGLTNFVWNENNVYPNEYARGIAMDLRNMFSKFGDKLSWLDNLEDIERALNISGTYRGTRAGDYGDLARALATYNGIKDGEVYRFNTGLKYKTGGQLVSRNPVKRFKQGGVSSFGKAFREARAAGLKEFEWNGKKYTTELKEEKEAKEKQNKPKMKQMFVPDDKNKRYFKTDSGHVASIGPMSIKFIPK